MNGKRIVFCAFGSLGDVYPILALARELRRRGDSPVIATNAVYRQLVESEGVAFYPVRPDVDVSDPAILRRAMDRRNGARYIFGELILPSIRETYSHTPSYAGRSFVGSQEWDSLGVRRAFACKLIFNL